MTRSLDREKARKLRKQGKSYSEIKEKLKISKSTLSGWLQDLPLSDSAVRKLRDLNPRRIENFRKTMRKKREVHMLEAYEKAAKDIGHLSKRDMFIAGIHLYWGEGTKSAPSKISLANTDPGVLQAFKNWLMVLGVLPAQMRARLHLYSDMKQEVEVRFWSRRLGIPISHFRKAHIKKSTRNEQSYSGSFGHGTCELTFGNIEMWRYISMALKRMRELHSRP